MNMSTSRKNQYVGAPIFEQPVIKPSLSVAQIRTFYLCRGLLKIGLAFALEKAMQNEL